MSTKIDRRTYFCIAELERRSWRREWIEPLLGDPIQTEGAKWWPKHRVLLAERDGSLATMRRHWEAGRQKAKQAEKACSSDAIKSAIDDLRQAAHRGWHPSDTSPEAWIAKLLNDPKLSPEAKRAGLALAWAFQQHGDVDTRIVEWSFWMGATASSTREDHDRAHELINVLLRASWIGCRNIDPTGKVRGQILTMNIPEGCPEGCK